MSFSKAYLIICLLTTCVILSLVNGHPDGAPESVCDTMVIPHDNEGGAQNSTNPYMIMMDSDAKTGDSVSVYIMSDYMDVRFEGILLKAINGSQAESDYSGTAGSFSIADADKDLYHYLNCSGSPRGAVTHSTPDDKQDVTFTWQAPATAGSYVFILSIAQNHDVYWLPLRSDPIHVSAGVVGHANKLAIFIVSLLTIAKCLYSSF